LSEDVVAWLKHVHEEAERLVKEWWPDTAKFPAQKRMGELAVMKMLIDIEYARRPKPVEISKTTSV